MTGLRLRPKEKLAIVNRTAKNKEVIILAGLAFVICIILALTASWHILLADFQ